MKRGKMNFFTNITYIGRRYFGLKSKPQEFSRRALMKALGYNESGASYTSWRKGMIPAGSRMTDICRNIEKLIRENDQIELQLSPDDLLYDSLEQMIGAAKKTALVNFASTIATENLSAREKNIIALLRLLEKHSEYALLVKMIDTLVQLIALQIDDSIEEEKRCRTEFVTLKNILMNWIKPQIDR
jgi:hypothetical protein